MKWTRLAMRELRFAGLVTCLITGFAPPAGADDLAVPPWRATDGSTFQEWTTFPSATRFGVPPNGLAFPGPADQQAHLDVLGNATWANNVWTLGPRSGNTLAGRLDFTISNVDEPMMSKEVWVSITYTGARLPPPDVDIAPSTGGPLFTDTGVLDNRLTAKGDFFNRKVFTFPTCPESEVVSISKPAAVDSIGIKQVVIDTRCVPMPIPAAVWAGLALLTGFGAWRVVRRRYRHCAFVATAGAAAVDYATRASEPLTKSEGRESGEKGYGVHVRYGDRWTRKPRGNT